MKNEDKKEFMKILMGMGEIYDKEVGDSLLLIYWGALGRYTLKEIKNAAQGHTLDADRGRFMPKPADFVHQIEGDIEIKAVKKWAEVIDAIGRIGGYNNYTNKDRAVIAAIEDMGGWRQLCRATQKDLDRLGRTFRGNYKAYKTGSTPISELPNESLGLIAIENQREKIIGKPMSIAQTVKEFNEKA